MTVGERRQWLSRSAHHLLGATLTFVDDGLAFPGFELLGQDIAAQSTHAETDPDCTLPDYRALAVFLWTASIATTPPLTDDDPLRDWLDRGFDLYGGLGRHSGMSTLFGLQLQPGDPEPFTKGPPQGGLASRNTGPDSTRAETERITRAGA